MRGRAGGVSGGGAGGRGLTARRSDCGAASGVREPILKFLARPERFELPTPWFVARYSIQLSYGRTA